MLDIISSMKLVRANPFGLTRKTKEPATRFFWGSFLHQILELSQLIFRPFFMKKGATKLTNSKGQIKHSSFSPLNEEKAVCSQSQVKFLPLSAMVLAVKPAALYPL